MAYGLELLLCIVVFLVQGMNTTIFSLGAGGSHPSNIPVVDKINIVGGVFIIFGSLVGGSVLNKIGPKLTLVIATSGYPVYVGSMWWLDQERSTGFVYFAAVYHGICAGLFYTGIGYVATSYAPEQSRGKYIGAIATSVGIGSAVGSGIVLGITARTSVKSTHVPSAVYTTIIVLQSAGILVAACLQSPAKVIRNDGQAIALFPLTSWKDELLQLPKSLITPKVLLLSLALFSSNLNFSFCSSLNGFYFNARTRGLMNLTFYLSSAVSAAVFGWMCDSKRLGNRRQRALINSAFTLLLLLASHSGLIAFLATHKPQLDRHSKHAAIDWKDGNDFFRLWVVWIFLGLSYSVLPNYLLWLLATFTNQPTVLSRYSGYVEAMKALGLITAFAVDERGTPFLTEEVAYFSLGVGGMIPCIVSAIWYTRNTKYGEQNEINVIVPKAFQSAILFSDMESEGANKEKVDAAFGITKLVVA